MKKHILFLLGIFVWLEVVAQNIDYNPFAEDGKIWNMLYNNEEDIMSPDYEFYYFIKGDTIINDLTCKKLYVYNEDNKNLTVYKMALYENEGKVFFIPVGSTEKHLLYDFKIPSGTSSFISDAIHLEWEIEMRNNKDYFVETNGVNRHCLLVNRHCLLVNRVNTYLGEWPSGWWIEGVGSELGPLNTWGFEAAGNCAFLLNCAINGQVLFSLPDFKEKTTGITSTSKAKNKAEAFFCTLYDLQGRKIANGQQPKAKGLYIVDGKKVAVK